MLLVMIGRKQQRGSGIESYCGIESYWHTCFVLAIYVSCLVLVFVVAAAACLT